MSRQGSYYGIMGMIYKIYRLSRMLSKPATIW